MDERAWLECADPTPMPDFLQGRASTRKLRLFVSACCRKVWPLFPDERSHWAMDRAERVAEGLAKKKRTSR